MADGFKIVNGVLDVYYGDDQEVTVPEGVSQSGIKHSSVVRP